MSLEESINRNTEAVKTLSEILRTTREAGLVRTLSTGNSLTETKPGKRNRRTKAQIAEDEKKEVAALPQVTPNGDPCEIELDPVPIAPASLTPNPLDILNTPPPASTEEEITEEQLRASASALCECGKDNQEGLKIAQAIIKKAGFVLLEDIPPNKYKIINDAFKLAVKTWKK